MGIFFCNLSKIYLEAKGKLPSLLAHFRTGVRLKLLVSRTCFIGSVNAVFLYMSIRQSIQTSAVTPKAKVQKKEKKTVFRELN